MNNKWVIIGIAVVVLLAIAWFAFGQGQPATEDVTTEEGVVEEEVMEEGVLEDDAVMEEGVEGDTMKDDTGVQY